LLLLFPLIARASFIESTMGAAVVNDATATYYNPSALVLLKNPQIIALGSSIYFRSHFTGQAIQSTTGFMQSGNSSTQTHYFLPSFYLAMPATDKITVGLAVISNFFNTSIEENSILRYAQSSNNVQDIDLVPAVGIKLNKIFSFGAGINFSYASFVLQPISGFPSLNIPDSQSRNTCNGTGVGGDIGFLVNPADTTLIGFNYRSAVTYSLNGKSILASNPEIISDHYGYHFWTPARSVISVNQSITSSLGVIGTIQRVQWDIFKDINIHGIVTQIGSRASILNADVPYHLHNTWILTIGSHYRLTPKWIIRAAATYNESPGNSNFQITTGNSIIAGASIGYKICKDVIVDGSYAHAFIQNESINITTGSNMIKGLNKSYLDAVSLKITFNF